MGDNKTFYAFNIASEPPEGLSNKGDESVSSEAPLVHPYQTRGKPICGLWSIVVTLAVSIIVSFIIWQTNLFPKMVGQQLVLKNGTKMFDYWMVDPVTTTFTVHLFNYTNVDKFEDGIDSKLKLQDIGPFSYTVTTMKKNVTFNNDGTVSYQDRKIYKFAPELSNGSLDDFVIVPNIPYLSALNQVVDSYAITRWAFGQALSKISPFIKVSIKELIWGYDDQIFRIAAQVLKYQNQNIPFSKFGLWAGKNGTLPDIITIHTGEKDFSKKGLISRFNGEKMLQHWGSDQCNRLEAYPGSAVSPFLSKNPIHLYTKDACRTLPVIYQRKTLKRGVISSHYELAADFLSNEGDNDCFCAESCLPNGALNSSACAFGAPVITSKPHFLHGDPILYEKLDGIVPNEKKHKTYLDVESNLGLIIDGATAAQMNVMLRNKVGMQLNSNYPDMLILPVTWIRLSLDEFPTIIHAQLVSLVAVFGLIQLIVYYVPIITMAISILILIYRQFRRDQLDNSIENSIIIDNKA